jgi:hypothetical protein
MPKPPEVLTGLRDPQDVRMDRAKEREASGAQAPSKMPVLADPSLTVYESQFSRYRVQITSPDESKDPTTGHITRNKPLVAQFENGRWVNQFKNPEHRKLADLFLQGNDFFGMEGHFWLKKDADTRDIAISKDNTRRTLAALPKAEVQELLREMRESGELDLDLPAKANSRVLPDELNSELAVSEKVAQ